MTEDARRLSLVFPFLLLLCTLGCSQPSAQQVPLEEKIGQMLMVGFRGMEVTEQSPIAEDIRQLNLGGVILFDYDVPTQTPKRNIKSPKQLQALTSQLQELASTPLFIAIDQEGGKVVRLKPKFGFPKTVSAAYLGQLNRPDSTRFYADQQAELIHQMGINVNFTPVVDLNTNPDNPVIGRLDRSFSADPSIVTRHAGIVVHQHLQSGVMPVLKHFPGHGSAWNDSHKGIADVTDTWQRIELQPYENLIRQDSIPAIMTAHVFNAKLDSTYPATLSKPVLSGVLRDSLNFDGLIFSDDMQMDAIRAEYGLETAIKQSVNAGIDVLVFANNSVFQEDIAERAIAIITRLVENDEISKAQIEDSYQRIMKYKKALSK